MQSFKKVSNNSVIYNRFNFFINNYHLNPLIPTDLIVPNRSSSALLYKVLAWILAISSGCKLRIACTATRETALSYNNAYHLCCISCSVKRQENFVPRWTLNRDNKNIRNILYSILPKKK